MTERLEMCTKDLSQEKIRLLGELFPNCITESKENERVVRSVDFDALRQELSDHVVEGPKERYQFTWPDKNKARVLANTPTTMTLRPCREESVDFDTTKNLYIEGDNLEVLKILRETYLGKVKMIYIDPPYNTGNDFVYDDDYSISSEEYIQKSGDISDLGERLFLNTSNNGRFHTDWLNMIYPRLLLSKDLLTDDGVIFISIDENEVDNLSKICTEIFGERNHICKFIWKSKLGKVGTTSLISTVHEYILCFAKKIENVHFKTIQNVTEGRKENLRQWGIADRREDRPSMYYPITIDGITVYPTREDGTDGRWRVGEDMAKQLLDEGRLELNYNKGKYSIYRTFPPGTSNIPYDTLLLDSIGTTAKGATMLKTLEMNKMFDYSKPTELIEHFAMLCTDSSDIVMDFFSGSGTTAQAIINLNVNGGKRSFIMVQLPEETDPNSEPHHAGFNYISDIGKERIRRAGSLINNMSQKKDMDLGFRVYKLDSSNMTNVFFDPELFKQMNVEEFGNNVKPDRSSEDLLTQAMLELGIELSAKIETESIENNPVSIVDDGYLVACLSNSCSESIITALAKREIKPTYAVIRNGPGMTDQMLSNIEQIFKTYSPGTEIRLI